MQQNSSWFFIISNIVSTNFFTLVLPQSFLVWQTACAIKEYIFKKKMHSSHLDLNHHFLSTWGVARLVIIFSKKRKGRLIFGRLYDKQQRVLHLRLWSESKVGTFASSHYEWGMQVSLLASVSCKSCWDLVYFGWKCKCVLSPVWKKLANCPTPFKKVLFLVTQNGGIVSGSLPTIQFTCS